MLQQQLRQKHAGLLTQFLDALLARSGFFAYLPITFVTISIFCGSSWQIFLPNSDAARYQCYALTFWLGSSATQFLPISQCTFLHITAAQPPFHMLPLEYPPLTLVPFSLALVVPLLYYQLAFALLMSLTSILVYWLLLRYGPRGAAAIFALYIFLGALGIAQNRFDLIPAALTLLCLIAAEQKHWTSAYIALAFAVLLKIYPILLLPVLFIAEQQDAQQLYTPPTHLSYKNIWLHVWKTLKGISHWHWKNVLIFSAILLGITGIFALINVQGAFVSQLSYFAQRPIQVEATGSVFLWLGAKFGMPFMIVNTYGSINIVSRLGESVSLISEVLFVAGCLYTVWLQWRRTIDMTQASIALLLVFVATGKVFSPQYLIWLMPLLAYAGAFDAFWLVLWGSISLLTTYIYIYLYSQSSNPLGIPYVAHFFPTVGTRNLFFIIVTLAYLFNWFQARQRRSLPPLATGRETRRLYKAV